eukprot:gene20266-26310_t
MVRYTEPFKTSYDRAHDSFLHYKFAVAPAAILGLLTNIIEGFGFIEVFWTFSIYLEAFAIIPQLIVLQRYQEVENLTGNYVFFLVYLCGLAQTALYLDFFYYFIQSKYRGGRLQLPK